MVYSQYTVAAYFPRARLYQYTAVYIGAVVTLNEEVTKKDIKNPMDLVRCF